MKQPQDRYLFRGLFSLSTHMDVYSQFHDPDGFSRRDVFAPPVLRRFIVDKDRSVPLYC